MKLLNNEEMAMSQSGYNWSALGSQDCLNCLAGIAAYAAACVAIGVASIPTGGAAAVAAAVATPLLEGLAGAATIAANCPPCWQKLNAE